YGTLEKILENVESIKNKRCQTALLANSDKAVLSKKLVNIVCDLKLKFSYEETSYQLKYSQTLESFLNKVGFKSWQTKLAEFKDPEVASNKPTPEKVENKLVSRWSL